MRRIQDKTGIDQNPHRRQPHRFSAPAPRPQRCHARRFGSGAPVFARHLEVGLPATPEFLDSLSPQHTRDGVTWDAMGGRTTKSQSHRQLASSLICPVGFNKNGTAGGVKVAANAVVQDVAKQVRGSAAPWA